TCLSCFKLHHHHFLFQLFLFHFNFVATVFRIIQHLINRFRLPTNQMRLYHLTYLWSQPFHKSKHK
ncbi:hypothetical protein NDU88_005200, partial [Pleurodeles waltl]